MDNKKENKRYYWLKLQSTYFNQLEQKKMKKQENGKEMQVVYLRMMLSSIDKGGYIYYQGVFDTLEEELAEEFDEDIGIIRKTLEYLQNNNMISINENSDCFIPEALEHTGSECYSAERMRRMRSKNKMSQCDKDVTLSDEEKDTETERELRTETETEDFVFAPASASALLGASQSCDLFSVDELISVVEKNKINLSMDGVIAFFQEMQTSNWVLYGKPVNKNGIVKTLRGYSKYNERYHMNKNEQNTTVRNKGEFSQTLVDLRNVCEEDSGLEDFDLEDDWKKIYTVKITRDHFEYLKTKYRDIEGMYDDDYNYLWIEPQYYEVAPPHGGGEWQ